ncbi:HAD-IIA family hydrolase [Cumulibacter soli]|uniref:HAD-IIA family hydrolase n=1 Tax=Cumulibacter soli TaxID=2546344 RepID=UPI0010678BB7|nr:HAD-IIA family hydrolase [Cumulibacter soli]
MTSNNLPLCESYDVGLFDLDGVVYAGSARVPHAAASIEAATQRGMRAAYVTNNASRTPQDVADKLNEVGVTAHVDDIITSAQVAADVLAERLPAGAAVLVVGDRGLREAVTSAGLLLVATAEDKPAAVVQGFSTQTGWEQLAEATIAVRAGALWVASNLDSTLPTDRGVLPGNGAFVAMLADVLQTEPDVVAGKPARTMHRASVARTGAQRPLVIGDRLDTDIAGAAASDCASLYVMTGISRPAEVVAAPTLHRPTYVASDLRGLLQPGRSISAAQASGRSGRWIADQAGIRCDGPAGADDAADLLALICALAWSDRAHTPLDDNSQVAYAALGLGRTATGL